MISLAEGTISNLLFVFAGGGAGDAKLMATLGAWLGLTDGVTALFAVVVSGIVGGLAYAVAKKQLRGVLSRLRSIAFAAVQLVFGRGRRKEAFAFVPAREEMLAMPYSVAILSGVCLATGVSLLWTT